jgi:anaerobic selenocysteine-containing dehydrogenase
MTQSHNDGWHQTACILCSLNCGIEVKLDAAEARHIERIRGDKAHPASQGYTCEKPQRLDSYQTAADRLTSPLRRKPDGTFEAIDWDTAIAEVAERFLDIKSRHGGETIL